MRLTLPAALCLLVLSTGCRSGYWSQGVAGEGPFVATERSVASFDEIDLAGGMRLDVRVGEPQRVVIHADENLHEYITTEVLDGRLLIRFSENVSSRNALRAEIGTGSLRTIEVAGSATLDVQGVDSPDFVIDIAGSGSGSVRGRCERLVVDIAGSSSLDLYGLLADEVTVDIAGSGTVLTHANRRLDVDITGSGKVLYHGQPDLTIDQAGSATVRAGD